MVITVTTSEATVTILFRLFIVQQFIARLLIAVLEVTTAATKYQIAFLGENFFLQQDFSMFVVLANSFSEVSNLMNQSSVDLVLISSIIKPIKKFTFQLYLKD